MQFYAFFFFFIQENFIPGLLCYGSLKQASRQLPNCLLYTTGTLNFNIFLEETVVSIESQTYIYLKIVSSFRIRYTLK